MEALHPTEISEAESWHLFDEERGEFEKVVGVQIRSISDQARGSS